MEKTLKLGEWAVVGSGWLKKRRIMFAGESSPGVFSVAVEWTEVHNSAASNLYFHESQKGFQLFDGHVTVLHASKDEFRFRFEK